jgi:hypothetical protein
MTGTEIYRDWLYVKFGGSFDPLIRRIKCPFHELDNVRRSPEDSTIVGSKIYKIALHKRPSSFLVGISTMSHRSEFARSGRLGGILGHLVLLLLESTLLIECYTIVNQYYSSHNSK